MTARRRLASLPVLLLLLALLPDTWTRRRQQRAARYHGRHCQHVRGQEPGAGNMPADIPAMIPSPVDDESATEWLSRTGRLADDEAARFTAAMTKALHWADPETPLDAGDTLPPVGDPAAGDTPAGGPAPLPQPDAVPPAAGLGQPPQPAPADPAQEATPATVLPTSAGVATTGWLGQPPLAALVRPLDSHPYAQGQPLPWGPATQPSRAVRSPQKPPRPAPAVMPVALLRPWLCVLRDPDTGIESYRMADARRYILGRDAVRQMAGAR